MNGMTISVIIPVYQVSAYVERCLRSVMQQTYSHFECILVDDATEDDSIGKCERMIAEYEGDISFRILHHQQNRGLSAARNTGIDAAKGDYLLFVDSDDKLSNDCLERLMAPVLRDESIEMVMGGTRNFSDGDMPKHKRQPEPWPEADYGTKEAVRNLYLNPPRSIPPAAWNKLTSRSFINRHGLRFEEGMIWEDALWTFFEMKHLQHVYIIPQITYYYFYRPDSITFGTGQEKRLQHAVKVCDIVSSHFTPGDERREANLFFTRFCFSYVRMEKTPELHEVCRRFRRALSWRHQPRQQVLLLAADRLPRNKAGNWLFRLLRRVLRVFVWVKPFPKFLPCKRAKFERQTPPPTPPLEGRGEPTESLTAGKATDPTPYPSP